MAAPIVDNWDTLRGFQVAANVLMVIGIPWLLLVARDRRRALDDRLSAIEEQFKTRLNNIERQISDFRTELRESRQEAREGRKECEKGVRAIAVQVSEYPRRREMQEAIADIWREMRGRRGGGE